MSRGDVCWLEMPDQGRHPVCVLTRDAAIPVLRNVVVAVVTRTIRGLPSEVRLDQGDGMPSECAISLDNLETVPKALLTERITRLSGVRINQVCHALVLATACA